MSGDKWSMRSGRPEDGLARHRMTPAEFAEVLGLDLETLRDWEEGRREPGAAALSLVLAFDEAPDAMCAATLERVA